MCTDVYWCVLMCNDVYWCVLIWTDVYWCELMSIDAYWWVMMNTDAYWCIRSCVCTELVPTKWTNAWSCECYGQWNKCAYCKHSDECAGWTHHWSCHLLLLMGASSLATKCSNPNWCSTPAPPWSKLVLNPCTFPKENQANTYLCILHPHSILVCKGLMVLFSMVTMSSRKISATR